MRKRGISSCESFQKVTKRSRMMVTIQTRILNTFSTQRIKIIQGNIVFVSNFHMDMFGNVFKFWCYDPSLCSPGQGGFSRFLSVQSLFDSHLPNVYRVFFFLQLETSLSVSGPATKRETHFLWSKFFFSVFFFEVFEAMDHRNLYYHSTLQVVH